ncbi:DMT family transporter [Sporosalibacterium faouarense]|uniref:DMT family transporter n=1 Tax=Sporosalibacterium faouarense TaxID=516123 RepID=UPI00141CDC42|nr:DMT family transporter [Sporosalibacterium faouarense]MTI47141.1 EamA-like transporter family protein [Bacillota bacterium]
MFYIAILLSILAGVSIVLARIINANLAKHIGLLQGTFFNYIIGLFVALIVFLLVNKPFTINNLSFSSLPLWAYLGGLVGVLVVGLSSYMTHKIPTFYLTLLIFIGQLFAGIIIDYLSLNQVSIGKVMGGLLVLSGLSYNLILDKKKNEKLRA